MRISPSDIRNTITNAAYRVPKTRPPTPSADGPFRKAIREYHVHGVEVATHYIESALTKPYWHSGPGLTLAKNARQHLDVYIDLATADNRVAATVGARHTVDAIGHQVAADVDVVLQDRDGYVGRICITANLGRALTPAERALVAAAPLRGLVEEFEGGLLNDFIVIVAIEVWELRLGTTAIVQRRNAENAWPTLVEHLRRATGD
jgi:hypothetical protein